MIYETGMKVLFGRPNGEKTIGVIVKVNLTKVKIEQVEERGQQKYHAIGTVWTVPKSSRFITVLSVDAFGESWTPATARTEADILKDIVANSCAMSPENLSCDGELSRNMIRAKALRLTRERKNLVKELGREPTFEEQWGI